jgi:hypothetical protein
MGIIKVNINTVLEIDEDSIRSSDPEREEDIQDEIKWAIQRVQQGYDERVSWSIDYYLNEMMPKWVGALKEAKQGIPISMFKVEDLWQNISKEDEDKARNKWDKELSLIIKGFEAGKKLSDGDYDYKDHKKHEELQEIFDAGMESLKRNYFSLWD